MENLPFYLRKDHQAANHQEERDTGCRIVEEAEKKVFIYSRDRCLASGTFVLALLRQYSKLIT